MKELQARLSKIEAQLKPKPGQNFTLHFYSTSVTDDLAQNQNLNKYDVIVFLPEKSDIQEPPQWVYCPPQAPEEPEPVVRIRRVEEATKKDKQAHRPAEAPQSNEKPQVNKEHTQRGVTIERVFYKASQPFVKREPNTRKG